MAMMDHDSTIVELHIAHQAFVMESVNPREETAEGEANLLLLCGEGVGDVDCRDGLDEERDDEVRKADIGEE